MYPVKTITSVRQGLDGLDQYYVSYRNAPKKYNQWVSVKDMSPALRERAERLRLTRAKPQKLFTK